MIPDYLLSPQECFASLGTPGLHILDFCCFSTKAVNLPLTASLLHSFPCGIRSDCFPATPMGPWLASNWHTLGSRFGITECSAVQFLFSNFIFKFRSITFPPPYVRFLALTLFTLFHFLIPYFKTVHVFLIVQNGYTLFLFLLLLLLLLFPRVNLPECRLHFPFCMFCVCVVFSFSLEFSQFSLALLFVQKWCGWNLIDFLPYLSWVRRCPSHMLELQG